MTTIKQFGLGLLCGASILFSSSLRAAEVKTYQVTGPVLELTPTTIVVQKGDDKWEIARNAKTKASGEIMDGYQPAGTVGAVITSGTNPVTNSPRA